MFSASIVFGVYWLTFPAAGLPSGFIIKRRVDSQFMNRLNQDAQIVAEDFAESLVDLGGQGLAAKSLPKLCLDHAEGGFDIGAFVVMIEEFLYIQSDA